TTLSYAFSDISILLIKLFSSPLGLCSFKRLTSSNRFTRRLTLRSVSFPARMSKNLLCNCAIMWYTSESLAVHSYRLLFLFLCCCFGVVCHFVQLSLIYLDLFSYHYL